MRQQVRIRIGTELRKMSDGGAIPGRGVADAPERHRDAIQTNHLDPNGLLTVRYERGSYDDPILVIRRVDQRTALITDCEGKPYSDLMRIEDAIRTLKEAT